MLAAQKGHRVAASIVRCIDDEGSAWGLSRVLDQEAKSRDPLALSVLRALGDDLPWPTSLPFLEAAARWSHGIDLKQLSDAIQYQCWGVEAPHYLTGPSVASLRGGFVFEFRRLDYPEIADWWHKRVVVAYFVDEIKQARERTTRSYPPLDKTAEDRLIVNLKIALADMRAADGPSRFVMTVDNGPWRERWKKGDRYVLKDFPQT